MNLQNKIKKQKIKLKLRKFFLKNKCINANEFLFL